MTTTDRAATGLQVSCDGSEGVPPLVALLGEARELFVTDFEARLDTATFPGLSLAKSANVLRHLGGGPLRASQIVEQCGVSKQAVSQQLAQLERDGYVVITPDPCDQRARLVRLTPTGERAQQHVHQTFAAVETDWSGLLGTRDMTALRRILGKLLVRRDRS